MQHIPVPDDWRPLVDETKSSLPAERCFWMPYWADAVEQTAALLRTTGLNPEEQGIAEKRLRTLTRAGIALSYATGHDLRSAPLIVEVNRPAVPTETGTLHSTSVERIEEHDIPAVRDAIRRIMESNDPPPPELEGRRPMDAWREAMRHLPPPRNIDRNKLDDVWLHELRAAAAELLSTPEPTERSAQTARRLLSLTRARYAFAELDQSGQSSVAVATRPLRPLIAKHTGLQGDDLTLTRLLPEDIPAMTDTLVWLLDAAQRPHS